MLPRPKAPYLRGGLRLKDIQNACGIPTDTRGSRRDNAEGVASELIFDEQRPEPRLDKLSDHSALSVRLSLAPPGGPLASDPAAALTPPTLF